MHTVCGVDVSGCWLDARLGLEGAHARFARTPEGIGSLAAFCRANAADLVVFEASGGYEKLPFALLWAEGVACAVVNARAVRDFAKAMGRLEKTDRIDAGVIAEYGRVRGVAPQAPTGERQERLTALVTRLRQLILLKATQLNQARLVDEPLVLASIEAVGACLGAEIAKLEGEIASLIDDDPLWRALAAAWRTIKGVADRTVAVLAALLPEIGTLDNKAIAKLAGLAPLPNDSGRRTGQRAIRGGRRPVRDILFVITQAVRRWNDEFAEIDRRLQAAGKPKKVIRVALARRLLVRLNAKARDARRELAMAT